jgi:hypothetical protein
MERSRNDTPNLQKLVLDAGPDGMSAAKMVERLVYEHGLTEEGAVRIMDDEVAYGSLYLYDSFTLKVNV